MSTNDDWLAAAFNEVFPAHVAAFTDLMIALRRDFEGDLDMMIVLAVIGDRQLARRDPAATVAKASLGATPIRADAGI